MCVCVHVCGNSQCPGRSRLLATESPHSKLTVDYLERRVNGNHMCVGLRLISCRSQLQGSELLSTSYWRGARGLGKFQGLIASTWWRTQIAQDDSCAAQSRWENTPYYILYYSCRAYEAAERNKASSEAPQKQSSCSEVLAEEMRIVPERAEGNPRGWTAMGVAAGPTFLSSLGWVGGSCGELSSPVRTCPFLSFWSGPWKWHPKA